MTAKDVITNQNPLVLQGKEQKLCCSFETRKDDELYRCLIGVALRDTNQKIIKCATDEDCNREEGIELRDKSEWKYECVQSLSKEKHCCLAPHCGDELTFMRTELDCKTPQDCMRDEEDKSNAVGRAVCADFTERNQAAKKKKCCPIADAKARLAYCTKRNCSSLADCDAVLAYCHPTKHVCCHAGITRLDGTKHESSGTCQGFCKDKQMFGKKVAQYCVAVKTSNAGVRIVDRDRAVNPVYKTVFIISVILTLVFAFLAVIMFVNYRSKNFCDKYTPKKKKGKKGKKKGKESGKSGTSGGGEGGTEGGGTSGASGVSGTGADGTSGAGDGTSGAGTGAGDGASGTGA
ncbi:hypothetical protein NECAME_16398 [Necator americanus]|uniref:Uncharacterized protein n=1 Tax=Necator americanus TaxID=51031 RepID=W2TZ47_NECAM|nr:hypothetical protein NECAME_16398 [Necator americanus]ETN86336.1 hypothetical protein NECAME_16398 [Necator americanus]